MLTLHIIFGTLCVLSLIISIILLIIDGTQHTKIGVVGVVFLSIFTITFILSTIFAKYTIEEKREMNKVWDKVNIPTSTMYIDTISCNDSITGYTIHYNKYIK